MDHEVSSAGRSLTSVAVTLTTHPHRRGLPEAQGGSSHPDLRSRRSAGVAPDGSHVVASVVACHVHSGRDLARLSMASRALNTAVSPLLQQVRAMAERVGTLPDSAEPLAEARRLLAKDAALRPGPRLLLLRALATHVQRLPADIAVPLVERLITTASSHGTAPRAAVQAAMRRPDHGLDRGSLRTGFF